MYPRPSQLPHQEPKSEATHVQEQTLQDVRMPAQMNPAQSPGRVEMGVGTCEELTPLPQQPLPAREGAPGAAVAGR